ncbi:MAG: hypothetical protein ACRDC6_25520, partial [Shewanella sp.]
IIPRMMLLWHDNRDPLGLEQCICGEMKSNSADQHQSLSADNGLYQQLISNPFPGNVRNGMR